MQDLLSYNSDPWWIIINPAAGNGKAGRLRKAIEKELVTHGFIFTVVSTQLKVRATQLVKEGIQKGFRQIMAIGGDGTNNEVINGIMQQQLVPSTDITYTLLPVGTGNDWIKTHGIPGHFKKWIPKIATAQKVQQDIGLATYYKNGEQHQRYFANVAGLAYDAYLTQKKEESNPRIWPKIYYLWLVLKYLFKYRLKKARVVYDGEEVTDYCYTINIGICRYSGGGMQIVPHAVPDDGQLALTIARRVSKAEVLLYTPYIFMGKLGRHPQVTEHLARKIWVESIDDALTTVEVDGEFLGDTPAEFSIAGRLCLLRP